MLVSTAILPLISRVLLRHAQGFDVHTPLAMQLELGKAVRVCVCVSPDPYVKPDSMTKWEWAEALEGKAGA
eukprot:9260907-Alexandrium_andersonii.AAC.1